jgi:predicted O-methyltransferase YrrM
MAQADGTIKTFQKFLSVEKFDRVIELGTLRGGLAICIAEQCGNKFHTFDIVDKLTEKTKQILNDLNSSVYIQDIFKTNNVKKIIKDVGRVLLLCDNGNKPKEVKIFSAFLKPNDVIMAHDYYPKRSDLAKRRHIWRHCEITDEDINNTSLKSYHPYYEEFKKVFWMCKIKH